MFFKQLECHRPHTHHAVYDEVHGAHDHPPRWQGGGRDGDFCLQGCWRCNPLPLTLSGHGQCGLQRAHSSQKPESIPLPLPLVALLCGYHARLDLSFKGARVFVARPVRVSCQHCCVVCVLNTRAFLCERRALTTYTFCLCLYASLTSHTSSAHLPLGLFVLP